VSGLRAIALFGGTSLLAACVAIAGKCELSREPASWSLACAQGGSAIVIPPSTLQAIVPAASGAKP
jgi:hypothetical protein